MNVRRASLAQLATKVSMQNVFKNEGQIIEGNNKYALIDDSILQLGSYIYGNKNLLDSSNITDGS